MENLNKELKKYNIELFCNNCNFNTPKPKKIRKVSLEIDIKKKKSKKKSKNKSQKNIFTPFIQKRPIFTDFINKKNIFDENIPKFIIEDNFKHLSKEKINTILRTPIKTKNLNNQKTTASKMNQNFGLELDNSISDFYKYKEDSEEDIFRNKKNLNHFFDSKVVSPIFSRLKKSINDENDQKIESKFNDIPFNF